MRSFHIALALTAFGFGIPMALADDTKKPEAEDFDRTGADAEHGVKDKEMDKAKVLEERERISTMAGSTMKELFASSERAKELYDSAYGYAVFQVVKIAVGITGGGGEGIAFAKRAMDDPIYMEMATGGIGIGLGGQKYRTIFLFENQEAFDEFVFDGWEGDAEANAAAGTAGANTAASFTNGVVIYQLTDKGLLANADVSGTKYWMDEDLNHPDRLDTEEEKDEHERTD